MVSPSTRIKTVKEIYEKGLCTGCGNCAGVCPEDALNMVRDKDGVYTPILNPQRCIGCRLCVEVCPGYTPDLEKLSKHIFGKEPEDLLLGNYIHCFTGHSTDEKVRYESASGGVATTLLIFALEERMIDGAIVTKMSESSPLEPKVFVAKTKEEIISASKSKYCPVPVNTVLKYIINHNDRVAIVGLPCHIHGLRKAEFLKKELRDRVVLRIGLFCSHTVNFLGTEFLLKRAGIRVEDVVKLDYRGRGWPGGMTIKLRDTSEKFLPTPFYWGHFFAPFFFTPMRCTLCSDPANELADISLCDAWLPELKGHNTGESIIVTRTGCGEKILQKAVSNGKLRVMKIGRDKVIQSQKGILYFKKKGLKARVSLMKMLGKEVPEFRTKLLLNPSIIGYMAAMLTYLNLYISSRQDLQKFLKYIPLPILKLYSIVFSAIHYVG